MRSLTTDLNAVVNALRKSPSLLAVSEDGQKVKRIPPLPKNIDERILKHSIYAKGFPLDATIEFVTEFFAPHGDVKCVRLRKGGARKNLTQKDSVFVEFSSEDEAKKIASQEIKSPNSDALLKLMLKTDYIAKKKAEFEQRNGADKKTDETSKKGKQKQQKQQKQQKSNKRKKFDDDGQEVEVPASSEKKAKTESSQEENKENKKNKEENKEEKKEEQKEEPFFYKKDLLIHVSDVKAEATRENIRDFFQALGAHAGYVDFSRGQTNGTLQLAEADTQGAAALVVKAKESSIELGGKPGKEHTFVAITGNDEEAYWKAVADKKKQFRERSKKKKGGKRGGGFGGGGGRGKGKGKKRKNQAE